MTTKGLIKKYKRDYDLIIRLYSLDMLKLTDRQLNKFLKKTRGKEISSLCNTKRKASDSL